MKIPLSEKTVIAFDPGELTGVFLWTGKGSDISDHPDYEHLRSECENAIKDKYWFGYAIREIDVVIIESFRVYPHRANALKQDPVIPARIIGMLDFVAYYHSIPVVFQSASECKGFWTVERLKEQGYWADNKHERDALKHCLYYLMKESQKESTSKSKVEPQYYETGYVTHDGPERVRVPECTNCGTGTLLSHSPYLPDESMWDCGVCKHWYELLPSGHTRDLGWRGKKIASIQKGK